MWRIQRGNKYGAHQTEYNGVVYHSKKEAEYARELDLRVRAKDIKRWERQVKISLDVNNRHIANYSIDFVIQHLDKTKEYVEVKGFETAVWKIKWKLFVALYGNKKNIKLTIVK